MAIHNTEIAARLSELADLLEIDGANHFRVRAYRNAARTIEGHARSMAEAVQAGDDLTDLPGIGKDLAQQIATLVEGGRLPALDELRARMPASLSTLMQVRGLGPRRVATLHRELGIDTLEQLARAAREHKIRALPGFGTRTEQKLLEGVERLQELGRRFRLLEAEQIVAPLVAYLEETEGLKRLVVAGSYRRRRETVGDIDILATAKRGAPVVDRFVDYDEVEDVISRGGTRSTVRLRSGLQVDLRVVPEVSYGAALYYFTGSKAHNVAVRKLGVQRGLKINEYGVFKGSKRVAGREEEEVFAQVGLPWIEPELREDRGEIEAAREGKLPALVTAEDIRGDLHAHSKASDGHDTLEAMAAAAGKRGYAYLAITDHTQSTAVAHGQDKRRLTGQIREIDKLNERLDGVVLLKSAEVDILEDGSLDLPDDILAELDLTTCSVHAHFDLSEERQTERILRAMDNRHFTILGHPTGRLLGQREPYAVDLERVLQGARERGCFIELNAQPDRLDLTDVYCKRARELGVKVAICTDAHSTAQLENLRYGIGQARRGWLAAGDVLNTRSLGELRKLLAR